MRLRSRPTSQHGAQAALAARPAQKKIFNCIVDDTALVAGVKKSTRNGIRQWVKNGQIRLFVPLHALEELSRQRSAKGRHAEDVRETLQWLDDATSKHPDIVTLQGADETYEKWAEVEKFAVPRTLFSEHDHEHEEDLDDSTDLAEEADIKLDLTEKNLKASFSSAASDLSRTPSPSSPSSIRSSMSPVSPPTSPAKAALTPAQNLTSVAANISRPQSSSDSVPQSLQPLFNYILWRIHQELDPVAALESFIFLCNDSRKVNYAKGFDIKTKRLEQLREAVGREDRDFKNRQNLLNRESQTLQAEEVQSLPDSDDEEVVFKPMVPKAPAAMLPKQTNVIDPNAFERGPQPQSTAALKDLPNGTPKSPRPKTAQVQPCSPRGAHVVPFNARGIARGNARGVFRGRGRGTLGAGRDAFANEVTAKDIPTPGGPIDPDSFSRPETRSGFRGGRGGRKLWVPT
ncbi:hypothetical protein TI39_contig598g00034 [Zymoseptoria brevis]|uniref:PIN domain-containing protein n=1 Tax=Zymoseptoria brevis TaxID=1047168 RepID=A0A0F4GHQ9_9PEZI|nr:hypothetical protein TI39_contig598g00034 [Zymoseptoria brevis]